ncbi:MAG: aminotransferase class III-fold pyridoxal phosphate-dependent enzyme [Candidatus Wallbacteria bacterium]|nr:aminotransferase class III-fold pyridoxal phosphate-dependent enzyme [Candidatus Wallbacteria bacterium]
MSKKLKIDKSLKMFEAAKEYCPGGVVGIRKPENFIPGEYPVFIKSGKGGRITDVDGNEYVDLLASYGPIIIGHREEEIDNAVINKIKADGFCFNLAQPHQTELLALLRKHIPCAEMSFPVKTGSDAATAAVRVARAHAGKDMILRCGYHGWHDWAIAVKNGIPGNCYKDVDSFHYNDIDSLKAKIELYKGNVGVVIMTPIDHELNEPIQEPKNDFLNKVRELTKQNGIVLIFDEIRTGFRFSLGGAQKYYGVTPDMAIFGKAMANGYPISVVVGKREIMQSFEDKHVFVSSTFFPNSMEMVAAIATINFLEREKALDLVHANGRKIRDAALASIDKTGVKAIYSGLDPMPFFTFFKDSDKKEDKRYRDRRNLFYTELVRAGVFMQPFHHGYVCYRHTDKDINQVCSAVANAFEVVAKAIP